jgi:SPP1 gp7 family putative phage head morphogenesis protein
MALTNNPTKTRRIESAYRKETNLRFRRFNDEMVAALRVSQRDLQNMRVINQRFSMSEEEYERFVRWLRRMAYLDIIGVSDPMAANSAVDWEQTEQWQERYIYSAYFRGLSEAIKQTGEQMPLPLPLTVPLSELDPDFIRRTIQTTPIHREAAEAILKLQHNDLVQAIETMLGQLNRGLDKSRTDPEATVSSTSEAMSGRVKVANTTGETIASTSTIRAAQEAAINQTREVSAKTGQEWQLRWITRNDARVRDLHAAWHGQIMTPDEAAHNITVSPWNCRCGFGVVSPGQDTEKRRERFAKERALLVDRESRARLGAVG